MYVFVHVMDGLVRTSCQPLKLGKCVNLLASRVILQANLSSAAVLCNRDTVSSVSRYVSSEAFRNDDDFEEQSVRLSIDPPRYDSCSSVMSSEAAVCHNNCASVNITDPFMYSILDCIYCYSF